MPLLRRIRSLVIDFDSLAATREAFILITVLRSFMTLRAFMFFTRNSFPRMLATLVAGLVGRKRRSAREASIPFVTSRENTGILLV